MAQEVQAVMPEAVVRGSDGYLRVYYDRLGLRMQSCDAWVASGKKIPVTAPVQTTRRRTPAAVGFLFTPGGRSDA